LDSALTKIKKLKSDLYQIFKENNQGETRFKRLRRTSENSIVESTEERTTCTENCDTVSETRRVAKSLRFPEDLDNTGDTTKDTGTSGIISLTSSTTDITNDRADDPSTSATNNEPETINDISEFVLGKSDQTTVVEITIKYPCKTVRKVLDKQNESLAKALVYSSPLRIATAVMKCAHVGKFVASKVLDKLGKEVSAVDFVQERIHLY
jgi:hypothetical protein